MLHDAQVHQARALWLLSRLEPRLTTIWRSSWRITRRRPPNLGHLFAAGLGGQLFRLWPLVSLAIRASKLTVVHNAHLAARLAREHPGAAIRHLEMGVADPWGSGHDLCDVRGRHGIPDDACVIGAFGGITPEKRIPQLLEAVAAARHPHLHVLLVGPRAAHYDVEADVRRLGLEARVHMAGYVSDEDVAGVPGRRATSAGACVGPRTAKPPRRGCAAWPPGGPR